MAMKYRGEDGKEWSNGELTFQTLWRQYAPGLPEPTHDEKFHHIRNWRFDFLWESQKVAVEVEGATYSKGRHTRGTGYDEDCRKYNAALDLGFKVYRFSTVMLKKEPFECISQIATAIQKNGHK